MKPFDYIVPDDCKKRLRDIFPSMHKGRFENLVWNVSQTLIRYERSKEFHSKFHKKPSEHIRRLNLFKQHAAFLRGWINTETEYQDSMFFGCSFLDSIDNDPANEVRIANTRNALDHILYHELENAERAIEEIKDLAKEPRISEAFFRRELISGLVNGYHGAFGYLPSVYWDESKGTDCSEDCIQGKFIFFVEIVLLEAGDDIGLHSIFKDCKRVIAEHKKAANERDWDNLL